MTATTTDPATQDLVEEAMEDLSQALVEEVFEHEEQFLNEDGQLRSYSIFRWLVTNQDEQGLVTEATLGTSGSRWLLARKLADTLQETVDLIVRMAAVERAYTDMSQVFMFSNVMMSMRMNDNLISEEAERRRNSLAKDNLHGTD